MSEELPKYSFRKLINEQHYIRIPKIQRDYAEGRKVQKVSDIRQNFLNAILQVVVGIKSGMQMDFIYGYNRKGEHDDCVAFEPLDGQQRLTTLFVFYWLFNNGDNLLTHDNKSVFTYMTRISSEEFCDELVKRTASDLIAIWHEKMDRGEKEQLLFSKFVTLQDWFKWGWRHDPTIQSILIVIDCILKQLNELGYPYSTDYYRNFDHITFNLLDLKKFGLEDELYVKMNARGKELSDFDLLKSTLEEEIQYQINDGILTHEDESNWRRYMDKEWIDMMWDWRKKKTGTLTEDNIFEIEDDFRKLLLRMIALQMFRKIEDDNDLYQYVCSTNENDIDRIIPVYSLQRAMFLHSADKRKPFTPIDFNDIMEKMNALVYKSSEKEFNVATELFDKQILFDDSSKLGLMDLYLSDNFTRDRQTCFYGMEAFLKVHSAQEVYGNMRLTQDLIDWMRFCRDTFVNENIANLKIDKPQWELTVLNSIDELISDYSASDQSMCQFIIGLKTAKGRYYRVERSIIEEEKEKLQLRNDADWCILLDKAESNSYFHGQIPFLLSWSKTDKGYDKELFREYFNYADRIFPLNGDLQYVLYVALFCIGDFRDKYGSMMTFNKYKFRSWKACLRDRHEDGRYAPVLHQLIDSWKNDYAEIKDLSGFLNQFIADHKSSVTGWRRYAVAFPETLWYAYRDRVILTIDGHQYVAQSVTSSGHYVELFLHYLYKNIVKDYNPIEHDSKDKTPFVLDFTCDDSTYHVKYNVKDDNYTIVDESSVLLNGSDEEVINKIQQLIQPNLL